MSALLLASVVHAQTPEAFRYQAVARDGGGQLVVNTAVGVQFQLHQGSAGGTVVYAETHSPTTNAQGLFTVAVGEGTPTAGTFSTIDWSNGPYFVEVGLDPAGGTAYSTIGVQQLLSVPYALQAKGASTAQHADTAQYAQQAGPPGNAPGEIRYWNGTDWVSLPPGSNGQPLVFCNGAVAWGYCPVQERLNSGEPPCQIVSGGVPLDSLWGKNYLDGLIAYLDPNTCQGFVAATSDSPNGPWSIGSCQSTFIGATGEAIFDGYANTQTILAHPTCSAGAASVVVNALGPAWHLPSRWEVEQVALNLYQNGYGGITNPPVYWTSSEVNSTQAYSFAMLSGSTGATSKGTNFKIRGVRQF